MKDLKRPSPATRPGRDATRGAKVPRRGSPTRRTPSNARGRNATKVSPRSIGSRDTKSKIKTRRARIDPRDQLDEDLTIEAYTLFRIALNRFGISTTKQQRALKRSWNLRAAPRISGPLLRDAQSLSALLLEWSQEPKYLDAKGNPRVLLIKGPGDTFEALARQFLPHMALADVVDMACATAGVSTRPGGKIALLGDIMVNINKTNTPPLAYAIRQIDQLLETNLHNAYLPPQQRDKGRMQRVVTGVIPRAHYKRLMRDLRPQVADQLARADSLIEQYQPRTARELKAAIAVSVGVYVAEETDWERAGIDITAQVKKAKLK